jgi:tRNA pseudouridine55 synthase
LPLAFPANSDEANHDSLEGVPEQGYFRTMSETPPNPNEFNTVEDLYNGCTLVIDKPLNWTSFDVVNKLKFYVLKNLPVPIVDNGERKKFKIGHAGTLDPLATGMLVLCTGKKTRDISSLQDDKKTYIGTFTVGHTTPSYDLETPPGNPVQFDHLNDEMIQQTADSFIGEQLQTPPTYSAKWINGKRAYESARKGVEVQMRSALVTIYSLRLTRIALPEIDFEVTVSKGTYIRSLAHDFGMRLHTGAYLSALRRTSSGRYSDKDMLTLDELIARLSGLSETIRP